MKKTLAVISASITGILGVAAGAGATSTVMLDPPNISEAIGSIYNTAQPVWNSISPWVWFLLGFALVFMIARLLLGLFNR